MPNTHTWSVVDMVRDTSNGGVYDIDARISSTDGVNTVVYDFKVGVTPDASNPNFTPYDDLTEAQVLGWVYGTINKSAMEDANDAALVEKSAEAKGKPW